MAYRKIRTLLDSGAAVTAVAPSLHPGIAGLGKKGKITVVRRKFTASDLDGAFMAVCATDDEALNAGVAGECAKRGVLANIVDRPALCGFIVPAIVRCGDLTIAVSTGGASPALAKKIRQNLKRTYGKAVAGKLASIKKMRLKMIATRSEKDRKAYHRMVKAVKL